MPPLMCTARSSSIAIDSRTLITGAASGIGRSFAFAWATRGENLLLLDRDASALQQLLLELQSQYPIQIDSFAADLADPEMRLRLMKFLHRRRLRIDVLINCAGIGAHQPFIAHVRESIDQVIDVNSRAVVHLNRLFLPRMVRRNSGMIVNVSSIAAFEKMPDWAVYGASKAFVQSFTESLQEELAGTGVYIGLVCPGPTATPFFSKAGMEDEKVPSAAQSPDDVVAEAMRGIDQRRKLIVTGSHNRMRITLQRLSARAVIQSVLKCMRRLRAAG
jgi:short-subunit dehydrogenase